MDMNMQYIITVYIMRYKTLQSRYIKISKNVLKTPNTELYVFKMQIYNYVQTKIQNLVNVKKN